jgi:uncharacterized protein
MALHWFLPKNERFFDYFKAGAQNALDISKAFAALLENYSNVEQQVRHIRDLEQLGDDIYHQVSNALTQTFMTPLDREDIMLIAGRLDDFVDAIEDAARRMWLYRITEPTQYAKDLAKLIIAQANLLVTTMPLLENNKNSEEVIKRSKEIKRLEDEADEVMNLVHADLYDDASDVKSLIRAIRWGELYQYLEEATDRAQDVANTLEAIALKHA